MRTLTLVLVAALAGCQSSAIPTEQGSGEQTGGNATTGNTTTPADACSAADGAAVSLNNDLALARSLLPGRWRACTHTSDSVGPFTFTGFAGIELVADDSVTPAAAGGGRWFALVRADDGTLVRSGSGASFLYNPLPATDWEQIALLSPGQATDFTVSFTDPPRKLRLDGPDGWQATLVVAP